MIARQTSQTLQQLAKKFPVVALTGPRQSGKTTLLKELFPGYDYVSLENPDNRAHAQEDPNGFLSIYPSKVIIDEAQNVPHLFSYIQTKIDQDRIKGQYILSGSQHFPLMERITQSLAGRVALVRLLPFSFKEMKSGGLLGEDLPTVIYKGFYPAIYDWDIEPGQYFPSYVETYVERDVRSLTNVKDLTLFRNFLKLCAGRAGQILNLQSLANDCGISSPTAKSWLSILETSFIVFLLPPYYRNFNKRLIKSPKLYFFDTGLACYLLGMKEAGHVDTYYQKGSLFENLVIAELLKQRYHAGQVPQFYFWRDNVGNEMDLLSEEFQSVDVWEMKYGATVNSSYFKGFKYLEKIEGLALGNKTVV
ncbi:MAG TPA: ATP-binding protein, partial [Bacteroidetes bacterium]|nr:ATP-binding protein [Bacteroidota bacterium]